MLLFIVCLLTALLLLIPQGVIRCELFSVWVVQCALHSSGVVGSSAVPRLVDPVTAPLVQPGWVLTNNVVTQTVWGLC